MPIHNADIAAIFEEIADLLEIQGANPFRMREIAIEKMKQ
jgi:DNA polymerase (family 10)